MPWSSSPRLGSFSMAGPPGWPARRPGLGDPQEPSGEPAGRPTTRSRSAHPLAAGAAPRLAPERTPGHAADEGDSLAGSSAAVALALPAGVPVPDARSERPTL